MSSFCIVPVAPLRSESSHRSEMVSQLLFGETVEVLEIKGDFLFVKCNYDGYEGWCQKTQLAAIEEHKSLEQAGFVKDWSADIRINNEIVRIPFASSLPALKEDLEIAGGYKLNTEGRNPHNTQTIEDKAALLKTFAFMYLGTGYLWGGKSVFGADCSGYTQQVFKMLGTWLPRDSSEQVKMGEPLSFLQEARAGDLAFFDNEEGRIVHVGIMLNSSEIIHASGNVHIDPIDSAGIINKLSGARTHQLRIIKRIF